MRGKRIAIALDLDGVVLESVDHKAEAFVATFADRWPDWEERVRCYNRSHLGVPRRDKMRHLLGLIEPGRPLDACLGALLADYADRLSDALTRFPLVAGARELIESGHHDIFICSSAPMAEIRFVLDRHGLLPMIRRIHDGATPKAEALRAISRDYERRCLFVGDAAADRRAAEEAGVPFVLRLSGPEAEALDAPVRIRDFHGFDALVVSLFE